MEAGPGDGVAMLEQPHECRSDEQQFRPLVPVGFERLATEIPFCQPDRFVGQHLPQGRHGIINKPLGPQQGRRGQLGPRFQGEPLSSVVVVIHHGVVPVLLFDKYRIPLLPIERVPLHRPETGPDLQRWAMPTQRRGQRPAVTQVVPDVHQRARVPVRFVPHLDRAHVQPQLVPPVDEGHHALGGLFIDVEDPDRLHVVLPADGSKPLEVVRAAHRAKPGQLLAGPVGLVVRLIGVRVGLPQVVVGGRPPGKPQPPWPQAADRVGELGTTIRHIVSGDRVEHVRVEGIQRDGERLGRTQCHRPFLGDEHCRHPAQHQHDAGAPDHGSPPARGDVPLDRELCLQLCASSPPYFPGHTDDLSLSVPHCRWSKMRSAG